METRWIDGAIVVIYLLLSFGFGLIASKFLRGGSKGEEGYFLAGRKVPGWLAGTSIGVTSMNADVAPAYAGMAVVVGLPIAWFYLSRFAFALMIGAILFAYTWRMLGINTGPAFYSVRFGGKGGTFVRVWTALYSVSVGMTPWIGAGLLGLHLIFGPVFGVEAKAVTLAVVLPVLLLYVWLSGYAGVLITDLVQSLVIIGANLLIGILVLMHFGGPSGLAAAITASMGDLAPEVLSATPVEGHRMFTPLIVLAWCILPTIGYAGNVATEGQRVFSCTNARESMKSYVWSAVVLFLMLMTLTLPVLGLLPDNPHLYMADPDERERAYGLLLSTFLPVGVLGLALAALTASVMSTIDSHLNYGAQVLTNDVLKVFRPGTSEADSLLFGRLSMIVILGAAIAVVYNATSLIGIAITIMGFFGATLTFQWGQWWWWRTNFKAWVAAMVVGPIIYLGLGPLLPRLIPWWVEYRQAGGPTAGEVLGILQGIISMVISTITWVTVALCTKPESMEDLKRFYLRGKPMGLWGPVRRAIAGEMGEDALPPGRPMLAPGVGVAVAGGVAIILLFLGISQLFVGGYTKAGAFFAGAIVLGWLFRHLFGWYFELLEERHKDRNELTKDKDGDS